MSRPSVLVFAGLDPSGGAGIQADIEAIAAMGAHALPVITTLTVQDNDHVQAIYPVDANILREQVQVLLPKIRISAIKIGITGSMQNVEVIAAAVLQLRKQQPQLPVVLDPVLASGQGDALSRDDAIRMVNALQPLATLITPNLPEAMQLCDGKTELQLQAAHLLRLTPNVLIKGGHGDGRQVINYWFNADEAQQWQWPRLEGEFHGSGCTLASAISAGLAQGGTMKAAIEQAQIWTQQALAAAYTIAGGQKIPLRAATPLPTQLPPQSQETA